MHALLRRCPVAIIALLAALLFTTSTFADDEPYAVMKTYETQNGTFKLVLSKTETLQTPPTLVDRYADVDAAYRFESILTPAGTQLGYPRVGDRVLTITDIGTSTLIVMETMIYRYTGASALFDNVCWLATKLEEKRSHFSGQILAMGQEHYFVVLNHHGNFAGFAQATPPAENEPPAITWTQHAFRAQPNGVGHPHRFVGSNPMSIGLEDCTVTFTPEKGFENLTVQVGRQRGYPIDWVDATRAARHLTRSFTYGIELGKSRKVEATILRNIRGEVTAIPMFLTSPNLGTTQEILYAPDFGVFLIGDGFLTLEQLCTLPVEVRVNLLGFRELPPRPETPASQPSDANHKDG